MNIYRWEGGGWVVEITAKTLEQARQKAFVKSGAIPFSMTVFPPDSVRQCNRAALTEDCVKAWATS